MGSSADNSITRQKAAGALGAGFAFASEKTIDCKLDEAEDLAQRDGMSLNEALRILGGQTRPPYGAPRR